MKYLAVRNKKELYDIILPFFIKYNINNGKPKDFINSFIAQHTMSVTILYAMQ